MSHAAPIYLDHASTTPQRWEVSEAMHAVQQRGLANPASQHQAGRQARRVLEQAREEILTLLGARTQGMQADQLIFTSGGTEANHLALLGLVSAGERVLISAIEHPSVKGAAELLKQRGCAVDIIPVTASGRIDLAQFQSLLETSPKPKLVSIMAVNNETGVMQEIAEIGQQCRARGILLHTDAVQAVGKMDVSFASWQADALTLAPHKLQGPVGIGGLVVRSGLQLEAQLRGGFQQAGWRAGTEGVVLATGFVTALRIALQNRDERVRHLTNLQTTFERLLAESIPNIQIQSSSVPRASHISNVAFLGVDRQQLFLALDLAGVYCSTGSACASGSSEPSPVLLAMGLAPTVIESALRFSFGDGTSQMDVQTAAERILLAVNKLRRK